jgi:hypothetical protein
MDLSSRVELIHGCYAAWGVQANGFNAGPFYEGGLDYEIEGCRNPG